MQRSSAIRKTILVCLLLLTCYGADWSGDVYSFNVANRWRVFTNANGKPESISGGGFDESLALLAASTLKSSPYAKKAGPNTSSDHSAISSVFGQPIGESDSSGDDAGSSVRVLTVQSGPGVGLRGSQSGFSNMGATSGMAGRAVGSAFGTSLGQSNLP